MTQRPTISCVLPTYNGSKYLAQSIQSVVEQTFADWELIIVDDASTDDTPRIIAEYASRDNRIRSIRNAENRKLPASLNAGFAVSQGEYLTWTSDDNLYEPDAFGLMLRHLQSHVSTGIVYCDMIRVNERSECLSRYCPRGPASHPSPDTIGACFLYRREVYDVLGDYDTDMFLVEDFEYWLRASRQFPIEKLLNVAPYRYRVHSGSLTSQRQVQIELQRARAICKYTVGRWRRRRLMAAAYCEAAYGLRQQGYYWNAMYCYLRSVSQGFPNTVAIRGVLKLLPHWFLTSMRRSHE